MILQAPRDESWESFVDSLPAYEPRFIVYDFEFTDSEKRIHADLLFITWYITCFLLLDCRTPDNCSVKQKVIYSSSKRAFQSKLVGSKMIDAFDADDLREETIISKLM